MPKSPAPQTAALVTGLHLDWLTALALVAQVLAMALYLVGTRRLSARGRRWPATQTAAFAVGLVVTAYATEGGIARYQVDNFTLHVVQSLLLFDVAAPLLAFGAPLRLAIQAGGRGRGVALAAARSRWLGLLTRPPVAFLAYIGTLYVYFLSPLFAAAARHPVLLEYLQLQMLVTGVVLWSVVAGRDSLPRQVGYGARFALVLLGIPFFAFLGIYLGGVARPLYAAANTLHDTRSGGDVLWALSEIAVVAGLAYLFVEWAREEERRALRSDRQLEAALLAARNLAAPGPSGEGGSPAIDGEALMRVPAPGLEGVDRAGGD
jgi:putative copper resistance protein D